MLLAVPKTLTLSQPFRTHSGALLLSPVMAYEVYGNPDGPVVLITHGGFQNQHAAGKYAPTDPAPGPWDAIIGSGKAIDTDRYQVLAINSLGSLFGTTGANSINPATNKVYGPDFPKLTMEDMVHFIKAFLDELGITELALAAGPSMGGLQVLQLAALYPKLVKNVVAVAASGRMTPEGIAFHQCLIDMITQDPEFNNGYPGLAASRRLLRLFHMFSRVYFGHESNIKLTAFDTVPDGPDAQQARIENCYHYLTRYLDQQIEGRDLNCYLTILHAVNSYDLGKGMPGFAQGAQRIECPVLIINIENDSEFPPYWGQELADTLNARRPGQATAKSYYTHWGHYGCVFTPEPIAAFIKEWNKI